MVWIQQFEGTDLQFFVDWVANFFELQSQKFPLAINSISSLEVASRHEAARAHEEELNQPNMR